MPPIYLPYPGGMSENRPTFQRWVASSGGLSPEGMDETGRDPSAVPLGLIFFWRRSPTLKRWAIFACPSGTAALLLCAALAAGKALALPLAAPRGLMQTKRGEVKYTKPPSAAIPATVPQPLEVKDHLGVGESSWAILRFQDASEVKVRELTELEIVEPAVARETAFRLLKGEVYFSGLQQSQNTIVQTPHAKVRPKGTEFLIRVSDAETELIMFDGQAEMSNMQGAIAVKPGEAGLAETGRPPRNRPAIQARNIVQWWLYYPAVLDPAELQLSPLAQQTLKDSLAAYRAGDLITALEQFPGYPSGDSGRGGPR